jgi:dihydrodipicolinate synthase/N-acetylneuraminate lyase
MPRLFNETNRGERMNAKDLYKGVIVPMVTPLTESLNIDRKAVKAIVAGFVENCVSPFILGTTGEAASLPATLKNDLVKDVVTCLDGEVLVYAGISGNCLVDQIAEGKNFAELGADVLVATPPYYYPMSNRQMLRYFNALADALPKPLILYNMPSVTRHNIPPEVVDELSRHENIVGLKDSERDEDRLYKIIDLVRNRPDFVHLTGWAAKSCDALQRGSDGIVPSTGNLTPELYQQLYLAVKANNSSKASELQDATNYISTLYQKDRILSESIPALKLLMAVKGLCTELVMPPMYGMEKSEAQTFRNSMHKELSNLGIL